LIGTVAVTDTGWYEYLRARPDLTEVNFWRPSSRRRFTAPEFSPFLFKLRSPMSAICGFGYFARWSPLPIWLAWETFEQANGCATQDEMEVRLAAIRERIRYEGGDVADYIGCTLLVGPVFFPQELWIRQPDDWKVRTQTDKKYDLSSGEGRRVWDACQAVALELEVPSIDEQRIAEAVPRYGEPVFVAPRLGQRIFRIAVTDAYGRACAATGEHSLPALDAGHIRPFAEGGEHRISNGILLRADLHRLFDKGYLGFEKDYRIVVSRRLRDEFKNGKTYYPLHGAKLALPSNPKEWPNLEALAWHLERRFAA
jgi:putative restriction endonuclease